MKLHAWDRLFKNLRFWYLLHVTCWMEMHAAYSPKIKVLNFKFTKNSNSFDKCASKSLRWYKGTLKGPYGLSLEVQNKDLEKCTRVQFPDGLGVRIPDSHSGGPGSIPGQGVLFFWCFAIPSISAEYEGTVENVSRINLNIFPTWIDFPKTHFKAS